MNKLDLFLSYLTGDFNNKKQIEAQKDNQTHPYSIHITRECNDKIENLPKDIKGRFILEESYYTKPDGSKLIAPHLFYFELNEAENVVLTSYSLPSNYEKEELVNENVNLKMNFD